MTWPNIEYKARLLTGQVDVLQKVWFVVEDVEDLTSKGMASKK